MHLNKPISLQTQNGDYVSFAKDPAFFIISFLDFLLFLMQKGKDYYRINWRLSMSRS